MQNLTDAVEYRCCMEIAQACQKLTFDGSIDRVRCITKHDDFSSMTNRAVLLQVAPLLRVIMVLTSLHDSCSSQLNKL